MHLLSNLADEHLAVLLMLAMIAPALLIGWLLDVSWLRIAQQSPRLRHVAALQMQADEQAEYDADCRREQAIFDAVLEQDRKRHPAPWRRSRPPTI